MKLHYLLTAALTLMASSSAVAGGLGQQFGSSVDYKGTQCALHRTDDKAQAESKGSREVDSDRDDGRATRANAAS